MMLKCGGDSPDLGARSDQVVELVQLAKCEACILRSCSYAIAQS
jgi:hypothetical protein